jgi:hypothetical protein
MRFTSIIVAAALSLSVSAAPVCSLFLCVFFQAPLFRDRVHV